MKLNSKKWLIMVLSALICVLVVFCGVTVVADPYFHYHAPIDGLAYPIDNPRYQNDGIVRNFEYNAIITGSSMTENFMATEFEELYGEKCVKVPFSGGSFKEINDLLKRAYESDNDIKIVVRGLDYMRLLSDKDDVDYGDLYPSYLYDNNILNDASYVFNKSIFIDGTYRVFSNTLSGGYTTDFNEYCNWNSYYAYGKEAIIGSYYKRDEVVRASEQIELTEDDYERIKGNVDQNILSLVKEHPETDFYFFFTPYSILCWDYFTLEGRFDETFDAEKYVIELLLPYENIHLYSFTDDYSLTCNLDNYRDVAHYSEDINSQILVWMKEGKGELTSDNYEDYCKRVRKFYEEYDYDALFE